MITADVMNTPGYYYAIAYWLSALVVVNMNRKLEGWKRWLADILSLSALLLFMNLTDGVRRSLFIPSMIVIIFLIFAYIYFLLRISAAGGRILLCKSIYKR